jgi:hypothetical protein
MNSSEQGSQFERLVFRLLSEKLAGGELGLIPGACRIHRGKGYFSRDRKRYIVCDVSIEMYLPGLIQWSLLWVWECKDLASPVPVNDIEEFWAKLRQIAGVNVKGAMVSTKGFQQGTVEFAKAQGIALAQYRDHPKPLLLLGYAGAGKSSLLSSYLLNSRRATTGKSPTDYAKHLLKVDPHCQGLPVEPNLSDRPELLPPGKAVVNADGPNPELLLSISYGTFGASVGDREFGSWTDFLRFTLGDRTDEV